MICPRCDSDNAHKLVDSPKGNAWEVYVCDTCSYNWRSTDAPELRDPALYSKKFKLDPAKIPNLQIMPPYGKK